MLFRNMKPSLRIPLIMTIVVVMLGMVVIIQNIARDRPIPTPFVLIWGVVTILLIAISVWSWQRDKKK